MKKITLHFLLISSFVNAQSFYPFCKDCQVVNHTYYSLCYDEKNEQSKWVAYNLTAENVNTKVCEREDNFRIDPKVNTGSANLSDYKGSGYDRGHLCPAADMRFDCEAMSETFFMSNMSPQTPSFNRGIWAKLESKVRNWAVIYEEIFIVTGPVLNGEYLGCIGSNEVTVPKYYYKTILKYNGNDWDCIAIVLPNESGDGEWIDYVVTVDFLEKLTSIDFFNDLPDDAENKMESQKNINKWNLN